jgi:DNA-directed RNA polymerase specialized sigma24 family protein
VLPLERAVFVLREAFGFGFPDVANAVGRSEAACRQLMVRDPWAMARELRQATRKKD